MDNEFMDISTSFKLQLGYGIGHILNDVCASLWFTYFLVFFHLVLEFSASQAGNLMLIGQVVDALATPFVGYHSDRTDNSISARYGKRKLWHLFGTACVLASFPFIFSQCIGCSVTHKWAQMYYFAAFILIFQIGWAAVQISHLSLIPELAQDDHTRSHLTAVRYGFTVFSNLFVYIITWIVLRVTGECDKEVAGVYMSTRLVVNVAQVFIPLYLHRTLGLAARSLAVVPLAMYLGSLAAAGAQRLAPRFWWSCNAGDKFVTDCRLGRSENRSIGLCVWSDEFHRQISMWNSYCRHTDVCRGSRFDILPGCVIVGVRRCYAFRAHTYFIAP
ncbi:hypothetical protein ABMA27_006888 [Loxostege sticticalis]|uniref:Uncharacterized protein n=1 Tax=Loxostege sticticalis TaxID=481309 RepID=A0ABR3IKT3_LOXSC